MARTTRSAPAGHRAEGEAGRAWRFLARATSSKGSVNAHQRPRRNPLRDKVAPSLCRVRLLMHLEPRKQGSALLFVISQTPLLGGWLALRAAVTPGPVCWGHRFGQYLILAPLTASGQTSNSTLLPSRPKNDILSWPPSPFPGVLSVRGASARTARFPRPSTSHIARQVATAAAVPSAVPPGGESASWRVSPVPRKGILLAFSSLRQVPSVTTLTEATQSPAKPAAGEARAPARERGRSPQVRPLEHPSRPGTCLTLRSRGMKS